MKLTSQIFCLIAMCCQLLVASGLVYHTHECSASHQQHTSHEKIERIQVQSSCCGHAHHSDTEEPEIISSERGTVKDSPHHHPCNCQLHSLVCRTTIDVNVGPSRVGKTSSYYISTHADSHLYHTQNPSLAPPQKFFYTPPSRGSSGVALIHINCIYLI